MKRITISVYLLVLALFLSCKTAMRATGDQASPQIIIPDGSRSPSIQL